MAKWPYFLTSPAVGCGYIKIKENILNFQFKNLRRGKKWLNKRKGVNTKAKNSLKKEKTLKVDPSKYVNEIFQLLGNYQENTEYKMSEEKTTETDFADLKL